MERRGAVALLLALGFGVLVDRPEARPIEPQPVPAGDLTDLSLEDLMDIEVTSTARREQKVSDAATAIYVITRDQILRAGITSIPEALRLAPGLQVARTGAGSWAITSRGFNAIFAHWMLVLIDGRSVYTPLFGGVYWDVQDLPIEDIERIEVIRGPGAALWGANAVNGIINIITRKAKDTQGALATASYGTVEHTSDTLQYGGRLGGSGHHRVFARYVNHGSSQDVDGHDARDERDSLRFGFRADWALSDRDSLTLSGNTYDNDARSEGTSVSLSPPFSVPFDTEAQVSGTNVLARWERQYQDAGGTALQVYYDRTRRFGASFDEDRVTYDLDFQHTLTAGRRHEIVWGTGYRVTSDEINNSFQISFDPDSSRDDLFNAFLQDDIEMAGGRFRVTLGAKVEHNDYTGWEFQPSLRSLFEIDDRQTLWAAVSRAVRSPARADTGVRANVAAFPGPFGSTFLVSFFGDERFESEYVVAYEAGYRYHVTDRFSLDATVFRNSYDHLTTIEPGAPFLETDPFPPHVVIPARAENLMEGTAYGLEIAWSLRVSPRWDLDGSWTYFGLQLYPEDNSSDMNATDAEESSPKHQAQIHSQVSLPRGFSVDTGLFFVDRLDSGDVPSYMRCDARLAWRPTEHLELSVGGQNLLEHEHQEIGASTAVASGGLIERNFYGRVTWRF